jgi:hypothetical protein
VSGGRADAQLLGRWGGTRGGAHASSWDWSRDPSPHLLPGGAGSPSCGSRPRPSRPGGWGGPPRPAPVLAPSYPFPRALADLAGAGALHSEARGGAGPPRHCSTETRVPSLSPGPGAGARGPFLVSGWTRSYSVPRRPPKPRPHPPFPGPVGSGLGGVVLLSLYPSSVSIPPSVVFSYLSVLPYCLLSLFHDCLLSLSPSLFCPMSLSVRISSPHYPVSRAGPTGRTRLSPMPSSSPPQ